tara:strand:+ start:800 stop:1066 length:267 start_codon:yes stop_codon:yes gene_type:complete
MTAEDIVNKASVHFGHDVTVPASVGSKTFTSRCMTTYCAVRKKIPYALLTSALNADRTELRLMWLFAEGNMDIPSYSRQYKDFLITLK